MRVRAIGYHAQREDIIRAIYTLGMKAFADPDDLKAEHNRLQFELKQLDLNYENLII